MPPIHELSQTCSSALASCEPTPRLLSVETATGASDIQRQTQPPPPLPPAGICRHGRPQNTIAPACAGRLGEDEDYARARADRTRAARPRPKGARGSWASARTGGRRSVTGSLRFAWQIGNTEQPRRSSDHHATGEMVHGDGCGCMARVLHRSLSVPTSLLSPDS